MISVEKNTIDTVHCTCITILHLLHGFNRFHWDIVVCISAEILHVIPAVC